MNDANLSLCNSLCKKHLCIPEWKQTDPQESLKTFISRIENEQPWTDKHHLFIAEETKKQAQITTVTKAAHLDWTRRFPDPVPHVFPWLIERIKEKERIRLLRIQNSLKKKPRHPKRGRLINEEIDLDDSDTSVHSAGSYEEDEEITSLYGSDLEDEEMHDSAVNDDFGGFSHETLFNDD